MRKIMFYSKKPWEHRYRTGPALQNNSTYYLLFAVFVCGAILGSRLYASNQTLEKILSIFTDFILSKQPLHVAANSFCFHFLTVIVCLYCAFSCFGTLPLFLVPFFTGFHYALIASKLLQVFALKGLAYYSLLIIPGAIVSICARLSLCQSSISMSKMNFRSVFHRDSTEPEIKKYLSETGILFGVLLAATILDSVLTYLFSAFF